MGVKITRRKKIHLGIRKKIKGTSSKPRLSIYRSNTNIYVQAIDDVNGMTIAAAESKSISEGNMTEQASRVGKAIGEKLLAQKINTAIFDRSGYLYHGRVKALADGAREAGIKI